MLKIKLLFKYVSVNPIETSSIHFHVVCFDKLVVQSTAKKTFLKHQQPRVEAHTLSLSDCRSCKTPTPYETTTIPLIDK